MTTPVDFVTITDDMLRELLRNYHTSVGPYVDIMDALVATNGPRRLEARTRCAVLWNMLVEQKAGHERERLALGMRPPPTRVPGGGV